MDIQADSIDKVLKHATQVLDDSKYQIFEICETAIGERTALNNELTRVMNELDDTISHVDKLEEKYRLARIRLSEVSRDFHRFREEDIRGAYETATSLQLDMMIYREKEANLKSRRDELQQRIRGIEKTIERAQTLGSQMDIVMNYLSGDLTKVTRILESAKNRQLLGLKIILAQEEERKRIAREIHDGVAQMMANVVLRAEIAERMTHMKDPMAVLQEIIELKNQTRSGLEEIRKVIFNLRPMALDDLGLVPTLRKFTQDFEERTRIRTKFGIFGKETAIPSAMAVAIYRLVQEAFSNVQKHANATFVTLELTYQTSMVMIIIQDNGVGFQTKPAHSQDKEAAHFGLIGMRERVELLEGRLDIESEINAGTKITMHIPIKDETGKE